MFIISLLVSCSQSRPVNTEIDKHIQESLSNHTIVEEIKDDNHERSKSNAGENGFRYTLNKKKLIIIGILLGLSAIGAVTLTFVNVHHDYGEFPVFYKGYMGRRLLVTERQLIYRETRSQKTTQATHNNSKKQNGTINFIELTPVPCMSPISTLGLLDNVDTAIEDIMMDITTHCNSDELEVSPRDDKTPVDLSIQRRYVEDDDAEWRDLDYKVPVSSPPSSFCSFYRQYDLGLFWEGNLTQKDIEETKALLNQFRKWKKRKRKTYNIVVTERARREMADQEAEKNKKVVGR